MLFRGVKVKKGAVVKNCVLMQDTVVEPGAELDCVVTDKNVRITADKKLSGTKKMCIRDRYMNEYDFIFAKKSERNH